MSLEKLQLIATACAAPYFKVRWLQFWNSGIHSRQAVHFPPKGFTDRELEPWLNRASYWAWVSNRSHSASDYVGSKLLTYDASC
jgi:hypothetical protein